MTRTRKTSSQPDISPEPKAESCCDAVSRNEAPDGLSDLKEGYTRVFALVNVLGIRANHWGDVSTASNRDARALIDRGLLLTADLEGNPAPFNLPPAKCCGG